MRQAQCPAIAAALFSSKRPKPPAPHQHPQELAKGEAIIRATEDMIHEIFHGSYEEDSLGAEGAIHVLIVV